jgi:hypothetical protein
VRPGTFVYSVCGDWHAKAVETSLRFLKRVSKADIVVVTARAGPISHDQTLSVDMPEGLSDHQASILLKITLPSLIATGGAACYLDSDQIAVSSDVDQVFSLYRPPVTFAADHRRLDDFSRYGVRCGCPVAPCGCLRRAIFDTFDVHIADAMWTHWNGGLFLFSEDSVDFAACWRDYTLLAFEKPYWRVRDQGTLAAAAWRFGLERHATLPTRFNRIVDRFRGHAEERRAALSVADYRIDAGYSLEDRPPPAFLHFINGGVGARGWRNWDDAEALLAASAPAREPLAC